MLNKIDAFLNKITMYRLVLYYVTGLLVVAAILGFFKIIPYGPFDIVISTFFITAVCWAANRFLAKVFKIHANVESVYITAFILTLIITPIHSINDWSFFMIAFWASVWAMASKFFFTFWKKHIFNPAAIALVITAFGLGLSASWWVGTWSMLPFVVIGGFLMVRKLQRFDLVISFLAVAVIAVYCAHPTAAGFTNIFSKLFVETPLFFFAFIMLTEPLTTPPTRTLRILYGALVGFLFAPWVHIGSIYSTPELALIIGNVFSYVVSPKGKFLLRLREKKQVAVDTYHFWFDLIGRRPAFRPGQYLEWTLGHEHSDSRGNRRYFTVASAPSEKGLAIGVKTYEPSSSFKKKLMSLEQGDSIMAGQLAGDFTLPKDNAREASLSGFVFMAGGIGITPFRSMIRHMIDTDDRRSTVLFYSNKTAADVAYQELFDEAAERIGLRTIHALTDRDGYITEEMIRTHVPDYSDRHFYLSGPRGMVVAFEKTLLGMGVRRLQIKKDFFPGFV
jgi:ferredoxin-NADP reductase/Na+-translocating ferredoxin:NAD+ oxidoreductase RnfD subunit